MKRYCLPDADRLLRVLLVLMLLAWLVAINGCSYSVLPESQTSKKQERYKESRVSPAGSNAAEPALAVDGRGGLYLVYVEHQPDKNDDIFLQKFDAGGPSGERVRINSVAGTARSWRGDPPTIAIGERSTIYIGWTRKLPGENDKGNDLVLSTSGDGGQTFAEPVKVNDDLRPASHGMHSLAVDRNNMIYMAWLDERNIGDKMGHLDNDRTMTMSMAAMHHDEAEPNSEVFYASSGDGGKSFSSNKKVAANVCPCCKTSLLAAADGTIYAAWRQVLKGDHRHISVAHLWAGGAGFSKPIVVSDDNWQISACPVSGAAMVSQDDQTLDVIWYTAGAAGQPGIYLARSTDGGKSFGPRTIVSSDAKSGTPVLLDGGPDRTSSVYAGINNEVIVAGWQETPVKKFEKHQIANAELPSAVILNGDTIVAFVREEDGKQSVWVAR